MNTTDTDTNVDEISVLKRIAQALRRLVIATDQPPRPKRPRPRQVDQPIPREHQHRWWRRGLSAPQRQAILDAKRHPDAAEARKTRNLRKRRRKMYATKVPRRVLNVRKRSRELRELLLTLTAAKHAEVEMRKARDSE